jgi:hypothetical protein
MNPLIESSTSLVEMSNSLSKLGYNKLAEQISDVAVKFAAFLDTEDAHFDEVDSKTNDDTLSMQAEEDGLSDIEPLGDFPDESKVEESKSLVYECASELKAALDVLRETDSTEAFMQVVDSIHSKLLDFFDTAEEAEHILQKVINIVLDSSSVYGEERELVLALAFDSNPSDYLGE